MQLLPRFSKLAIIAPGSPDFAAVTNLLAAVSLLDDLDDEDWLKQEETRQLSLSLTFYSANRRRFANSSAVQGLLKG